MKSIARRTFHALRRVSPGIANFFRHRLTSSVKCRISGKDNQLRYDSSVLRAVTFAIQGSGNHIEITESSLNGVTFYILGDHHKIHIGRNCFFNRGGSIWFGGHRGELRIGEGSTHEEVQIAVTEPHSSVTIGTDCMFANDIDVRTGDSHSILDSSSGSTRQRTFGSAITSGSHRIVSS